MLNDFLWAKNLYDHVAQDESIHVVALLPC